MTNKKSMLSVQAAATGGIAAVIALIDLHSNTPITAAMLSFGLLAAAWVRLVVALQGPIVSAHNLVLLGVSLLMAYSVVYMSIPDALSAEPRAVPAVLPGVHGLVDALYFTTTTATTVGYGDQAPRTTFSRLLVMSQYAAAACIAVLIANYFSSPPAEQ
jgi:hypothetical protein